jgi:hypothetical protein
MQIDNGCCVACYRDGVYEVDPPGVTLLIDAPVGEVAF